MSSRLFSAGFNKFFPFFTVPEPPKMTIDMCLNFKPNFTARPAKFLHTPENAISLPFKLL